MSIPPIAEDRIEWPVTRVSTAAREWPGFAVELTHARHDHASDYARVRRRHALFVIMSPKVLQMQSRIMGGPVRHTPMPPLSWTLVPASQPLLGVIGVIPSFDYLLVTLEPEYVGTVLHGSGIEPPEVELHPELGSPDPAVRATAHKLRAALAMAQDPATAGLGHLYGDALGCALVLELVAHHSSAVPPAAAKGGLGSRALRLVLDYMRDNLASDIAMAELASLSGLSRAGFYRAFRQSLDASPQRHLTELRLARARELLATTSLPVATVGAIVGYPEARTFSALFRRWSGVSPRSYRLAAGQHPA